MKREIATIPGALDGSWCCPGHDTYPHQTYRSNRSKRARARDKAVEHRYVRRTTKQATASLLHADDEPQQTADVPD